MYENWYIPHLKEVFVSHKRQTNLFSIP